MQVHWEVRYIATCLTSSDLFKGTLFTDKFSKVIFCDFHEEGSLISIPFCKRITVCWHAEWFVRHTKLTFKYGCMFVIMGVCVCVCVSVFVCLCVSVSVLQLWGMSPAPGWQAGGLVGPPRGWGESRPPAPHVLRKKMMVRMMMRMMMRMRRRRRRRRSQPSSYNTCDKTSSLSLSLVKEY